MIKQKYQLREKNKYCELSFLFPANILNVFLFADDLPEPSVLYISFRKNKNVIGLKSDRDSKTIIAGICADLFRGLLESLLHYNNEFKKRNETKANLFRFQNKMFPTPLKRFGANQKNELYRLLF